MVLIAGPASSGKTTSCRRLGVHLALMGFDVQQMSLDDYFVDRENTPRTPDGEYDFEALEALDIPKLNEDLLALSEGKAVEIPRFDFITGKRCDNGDVLQMKENSILIIEGIHALNPKLTKQIPEQWKYRVYVSAMTQIAIDDQNIIRSSDNRLIRRMVRDYKFRGYSALETLRRWPSVRAGEQKHIFPYQENADVMFNSALMYELGILKNYAEPLLEAVPENTPEHAEACRLLEILSLFEAIPEKYIPPTSIMREFLGESSFDY
jgi:uridine kinase